MLLQTPDNQAEWEAILEKRDAAIKQLYIALGITPCEYGDDPLISFSEESDEFGYFSYFKCQTCAPEPTTASVDRAQADQLEAWLKSNNFTYFRGYPDEEQVEPDRRFHLDIEATKKLKELCDSAGLTSEMY